MSESLARILPPILIFFIGYFLKQNGLLKKDNANLFLRLCFYIGFPSVSLLAIPQIKLSFSFIPMLFAPALIIFSTFALSFLTAKMLGLKGTPFGVFLVATMAMNGTFLFPFIFAMYGLQGAARFSLIDSSAALIVFSFVYSIACLYGEKIKSIGFIIKKVLLSPPIWAIATAIILNLLHVSLPLVLTNTFQSLANLVTPLFMLSLGIYFHFSFSKFRVIIPAALIRSGFGLLIGFLVTYVFHVEGLTRTVILLYSATPVGLNTLVFSSLENLDMDFAANIVSFSVFLGIFYIPVLLLLIK